MSRPEYQVSGGLDERLDILRQLSRLMRFIVFANAAKFGMDCLHVSLT